MIDSRIDEAATAGFNSFVTSAKMPLWIAEDELFASAWHCGFRQAEDKAKGGSGSTPSGYFSAKKSAVNFNKLRALRV